ncbi:hypothetical protein PseudUWO311_03310 [Pseudanabaena sp. UWO311]|uniref:hypothetical protein n=1 Tax=Pseudanabaena sp. UWO311 TaxID=2487337 RepID=UPI00115B1FE0|nr:hypothetical protein [Pseudanabaena sp. UWO311]TYQ29172.1 hypothetical protein PseudUWO311_03310 [Pseudanabaena sp. UWO311]
MKSISRVLAFGLPLAAAIATLSTEAAFAQFTNLPFTGTVSGTVFTNGAISLNSYSLLSPIGTISASAGTITSLTSSNAPNIAVNSILTASGTTTGGVVFNDGRTASFVAAPTTVTNALVTSISGALIIGTPPVANTNVSLQVNSGNITIPDSSIVAAPPTPITTPTVIVQSPGIASALVILDPAFIAANPGISSTIVTAFSSDPSAAFAASPGAVYSSSLSSKVSPFLN